MTEIKTLEDIESERSVLLKRRALLTGDRDKLDEKIGDINVELSHLDIKEKRLREACPSSPQN